MTTPDIAGLCKGLRSSAAAFREHTVYDSEGDPLRLIAQADEADKAADTLERQAAEIQRLRELLRCIRDTPANEFDAVDVANRIRAALTGEDPNSAKPPA
jgi:hypothetical protein